MAEVLEVRSVYPTTARAGIAAASVVGTTLYVATDDGALLVIDANGVCQLRQPAEHAFLAHVKTLKTVFPDRATVADGGRLAAVTSTVPRICKDKKAVRTLHVVPEWEVLFSISSEFVAVFILAYGTAYELALMTSEHASHFCR